MYGFKISTSSTSLFLSLVTESETVAEISINSESFKSFNKFLFFIFKSILFLTSNIDKSFLLKLSVIVLISSILVSLRSNK